MSEGKNPVGGRRGRGTRWFPGLVTVLLVAGALGAGLVLRAPDAAAAVSSATFVRIVLSAPGVTDNSSGGHIDLLSFSWGASIAPSSTGTGTTVKVQDIVVTKSTDTSSPRLFREALSGKPIEVTINFTRAGGAGGSTTFLQYRLTRAVITGIQVSGGAGENPKETVSFSYGGLIVNYVPQHESVRLVCQEYPLCTPVG